MIMWIANELIQAQGQVLFMWALAFHDCLLTVVFIVDWFIGIKTEARQLLKRCEFPNINHVGVSEFDYVSMTESGYKNLK